MMMLNSMSLSMMTMTIMIMEERKDVYNNDDDENDAKDNLHED